MLPSGRYGLKEEFPTFPYQAFPQSLSYLCHWLLLTKLIWQGLVLALTSGFCGLAQLTHTHSCSHS